MYKGNAIINANVVDQKKKIEIFSPINNEKIGEIPQLNKEEINYAVLSSEIAYENWKLVDPKTKKKFIFLFADSLKKNINFIAQLIHLESGKKFSDALIEVERSIEYIVESIHAYTKIIENVEEYNGETNILIPENVSATYLRVPCGIALTISPFNYPVNLMITKIIPAILMGNVVIHKSATQGSLCGWYISKLFNELILDGYQMIPGVLNYISGKGNIIGDFLNQENKISLLSFTGSTEVGLKISQNFSFIKKQMEMGGINFAIVLKDADIEKSVKKILDGSFSFSGQRCTAIRNVLVHSSIYKKFMDEIQKIFHEYKYNFDPVINQNSYNEIIKVYEDAKSKGALDFGTEIKFKKNNNLYCHPIILENINKKMKLFNTEIFGPILGIQKIFNQEEAIELANSTDYGLQASIFTTNISIATNIALQLNFGRININQSPSRSPDILPFSAFKKSGQEVQGVYNSLYFFSQFKGVVLNTEKKS